MPSQAYELPRDPSESQRLEAQHNIYRENLGYLLHPTIASSIPKNAMIGEIGTGTGAWMLDLIKRDPDLTKNYTFEGLDMSPDQFPQTKPGNVEFKILNVLDELPDEYKGRYDVIHLRLLICGLAGEEWNLVAKRVYEMLKPGGWIQWCESDFDHLETLQTVPNASRKSLQELIDYDFDGLHAAGKFQEDAIKLHTYVEGAGFEGVQEDVVGSDRVVEMREMASEIGMGALVGIARSVCVARGGGEREWVEEVGRKGREELEGGRVYWRWSIHNVVGRKPV